MKYTSFIVFLIFNLMLITGCEDNEPDLSKQEEIGLQPDKEALEDFLTENLEDRIQRFSMDASTGAYLYGEEGTVIQFHPNSFVHANGDNATGLIDIKLIEIFDISTMVLLGKPTMGRMNNGSVTALKSGGQFFVEASKDGALLETAKEYAIIAPVENTGGPDDQMMLFNGVEECDGENCNIIWEEQAGERGIGIDGFQTDNGYFNAYYAFQNKFGWTNIDRWYNDPREKTTIFVDVPDGFDDTNCALFMAYKGDAALARFDVYDDETELFTEHYGLVPIGLEVHFILVSIVDDTIHYAIQSATIEKDHTEIIKTVKSISRNELIDLINDLP